MGLIIFITTAIFLPLILSLKPVAAQTTVPDTEVVPYGVNTFLEKEVEYWKKERTMQLINQGGVKWIKQIFAWNEIEFRKGYFVDDKFKKSGWQKFDEIVDLATKYGVKIVARVDQTPAWANPAGGQPGGRPANLQDYTDFLKEFVRHYRGKIQYITIWNEPNLNREWRPDVGVNPGEYVEMLKQSFQAIKQTDPAVRVMAAPLAITLEENPKYALNELQFLDQMYKAGAKDFFDIMPANAYGIESPPEDPPNPKKLNFRRVELLREVMTKNGDNNKAVWFNEYGWNASPESIPKDQRIWGRVSEQQQAEFTARGIKYARANYPWAGVLFVWFFRQVGDIPDTRSEQYFQMVGTDFNPKPLYNVIKQDALSYLQQRNLPTPAPVTPAVPITSTPLPQGVGSPRPAGSPGAVTPTAIAQPSNPAVAGLQPTAAGSTPIPNIEATIAPGQRQGATATATSRPTTNAGATSQPEEGGGIIIAIIGGLLVLVGGGGLAYWFSQQRRRG